MFFSRCSVLDDDKIDEINQKYPNDILHKCEDKIILDKLDAEVLNCYFTKDIWNLIINNVTHIIYFNTNHIGGELVLQNVRVINNIVCVRHDYSYSFNKKGIKNSIPTIVLPNLRAIKGDIDHDYKMTELSNLVKVGGNFYYYYKEVDLPNLEYIGGNAGGPARGHHCSMKGGDKSKLKIIGRNAYFDLTECDDLPELTQIGGSAYFRESKIQGLPKLKYIGEDADFSHSHIIDLGSLEIIGGSLWLRESRIEELNELRVIKRDVSFTYSKITHLDSLQGIGRDAHFEYSKVRDISSLRFIGGNVFMNKDQNIDFSKVNIKGKIIYV